MAIYTGWSIQINLTPGERYNFPFKNIADDGYTDEEMMYLVLHEMGHALDHHSSSADQELAEPYDNVIQKESESPSLYGYRYTSFCEANNSCKIEITEEVDRTEDFAETFSFYVMVSQYLKENFPARYNWFKENVFGGKEFEASPVPEAVKSRLTKPLK